MLSRHADGLMWLGRYIERAADVNRLLDVAYNAQLERSPDASSDVWRNLLRVLYRLDDFTAAHGDRLTTGNINNFLIFDADHPGSIRSSVNQARTNVMNVRDAVPIELLEAVNALHTKLAAGDLARLAESSPHEIYETLAAECRRIAGAVEECMAREDEYRFLMIGRMLERAEMTCRVVEVNASVARSDSTIWMGVLRSLSGMHAFVRTHGPLASADEIVDFLLHSESFPYGVLHCLRSVGNLLASVSETGDWHSPRALGRVLAGLEFTDVPPVESAVFENEIDRLIIGIRTVAEALTDDLFRFGREPSLFSFEAP